MTAQGPVMYGKARVLVFPARDALGAAAAEMAAAIIRHAVDQRGRARVIVATGNSQLDLIGALTHFPGVPWNAVEVFHMDEYVGLPENHPASFRLRIRTRVADKVRPKAVHYIKGDAADLDAEIEWYTRLLAEALVDLAAESASLLSAYVRVVVPSRARTASGCPVKHGSAGPGGTNVRLSPRARDPER